MDRIARFSKNMGFGNRTMMMLFFNHLTSH